MSLPPCEVCGSTLYQKNSGFYVCVVCDTQSQEIREEAFDIGELGFKDNEEEREVVVGEPVEEERQLTSWECFNLVLKGIVDELIALGASKNLKVIVFQLWACYLKKSEAAFMSTTVEKHPKLPVHFKNKDAKILYGIPNLRKYLYKDVKKRKLNTDSSQQNNDAESSVLFEESASEADQTSVTSKASYMRSLRRKQRKLAQLELSASEGESGNSSVSLHSSVHSQNSVRSKKRVKVKFAKRASQKLETIKKYIQRKTGYSTSEGGLTDVDEDDNSDGKSTKLSLSKLDALTMHVILCIVILALFIARSDIQFGDVLRWMADGRLSFNNPEKFLKSKDQCLFTNNVLLDCTRFNTNVALAKLARVLNITELPVPDFHKLVERYCTELRLPGDFVKVVHSVISLSKPKMDFNGSRKTVFPDYECRAMAFILFSAKLLFGLNGVTEYKQSKFAAFHNKERASDGAELFSWHLWQWFIECRKVTLAKYDPFLDKHCFNRRLASTDSYLRFWNKTKILSTCSEPERLNPVFCTMLHDSMKKYERSDVRDDGSFIEFEPSLNPAYCNLKHLIENHVNLIPKRSLKLLQTDFSKTSIDYLTCSTRLKDHVTHLHVDEAMPKEIELVSGEFICDPFCYDMSTTSRVPDYNFIDVEIEEEREENVKPRKLKMVSFEPVLQQLPSTDSSESEQTDDCAVLKKPNEYYWFHHNFTTAKLNNDFCQVAQSDFPCSFFWLLKQCSSIINSEMREVYFELIHVEYYLYKTFVNPSYEKLIIQFAPSEW